MPNIYVDIILFALFVFVWISYDNSAS